MPLPLSAFGSAAASLALDRASSGAVTNADAAGESQNRGMSGSSLARVGRVTGFRVAFAGDARLRSPGRVEYALSEVELYGTPGQAAAAIRREVRNIGRSDPANGWVVLTSSTLAPP